MKRTRVLHVLTRLSLGGAQRTTLHTCQGLSKDRYEVELAAGPDTDDEGNIGGEFDAAGIPVHRVPGLRRDAGPSQALPAIWRLAGVIRKGRYDVVHTHMAMGGVVGRFAASFAKAPVTVHTVHGWPWHNALDKKTRDRYIGYERRAAEKCDRIIVTSERDKGKGLANAIAPPGKFVLIRSGIDFDRFDPEKHDKAGARARLGLPEKAPVVISVGALTPQKNPLEALEVVARTKASFPELHYVLVGDGPLRPDVERRAEELGLGGSFHLLGFRDDVPDLLAAADVFLLTSRWEGLPRTLIEAMAMGKAVVATQVDGVLDVIEDNVTGYARDPGDIDELTAMCVRLFRAPNLITEMYKGNTRYIRKPEFRVDRMVQATDSLYQSLLREKSR
jgi:glycosyltransferase involved in cell wall biosynthesis